MTRINHKIRVVGIGGAGCNIINHMTRGIKGSFEFWAINADYKSLDRIQIKNQVQLTGGTVGALGNPELGKKFAESSVSEIKRVVKGAEAVLIVAGLGGGTGSGVTPFIAKVAKDAGAKVGLVVTLPFTHEGSIRRKQAQEALGKLKDFIPNLKVIPNDLIIKEFEFNSLEKSFSKIDQIIEREVAGFFKNN